MAESIIAEKFVSYYYRNLAYNPAALENIYSRDSVVKFHDYGGECTKFVGRDNIVAGIKQFNLHGALTNLEHGSIDCINYSDKDFLLSVTGILTIENVARRFNQSFILTQLQSSPLVFYVRTEMLNLFVDDYLEEENEEGTDESNKSDSKSEDSTQDDTSSEESESEDETKEEQPTVPPTHPSSMAPMMRSYNDAPRMGSMSRNNHEMRQDDRMNRDRNSSPVEIIFAKNLPDGVQEDDIRKAFEQYGTINQIKIFYEKKYSTVSFSKKDNNYENHEVFDRIMKENKEFKINDKVIRLEPFMVNHKRQGFNNRFSHTRYNRYYNKQ